MPPVEEPKTTETVSQPSTTDSPNIPLESPKEEISSTEEDPNSTPSSDEEGFLGEATKEEEEKKEEPAEEPAEEPEEYEIEFSEESPLSEDQQTKLVEKIGEFGLTKSQAEDLIKEIEGTHTNASNAIVQQLSDKIKKDREELMSSEFFKTEEARKESFKKIGDVVNKFGDDDFKKFLNSSSGNSLALAKFLIKINEAGAIDDPTTGRGASQDGAGAEKTLAEKWYPQFFEKGNK